ncbi:RICIN domain-containing protein [Kitasatospora sp. NPDC086009]|uniref:RICIN domain-containing protein n=1 Tax=unclassified Kitasatospora TaxID=2633591 RepID=UPI0037CA8098
MVALTVPDSAARSCGAGSNQNFWFKALGTGYSQIIAQHSGKCLDVTNRSTADSTSLEQWTCNTGYNQQWQRTTV